MKRYCPGAWLLNVTNPMSLDPQSTGADFGEIGQMTDELLMANRPWLPRFFQAGERRQSGPHLLAARERNRFGTTTGGGNDKCIYRDL